MVKIRVEGKSQELSEFLEYLKIRPELEVLSISSPVHNHGESIYYRSYVELNLDKEVLDSSEKTV